MKSGISSGSLSNIWNAVLGHRCQLMKLHQHSQWRNLSDHKGCVGADSTLGSSGGQVRGVELTHWSAFTQQGVPETKRIDRNEVLREQWYPYERHFVYKGEEPPNGAFKIDLSRTLPI